jgi:hypothetical protein
LVEDQAGDSRNGDESKQPRLVRTARWWIQRTCIVKKEHAEAEDCSIEDDGGYDRKKKAESDRDIEDDASEPNHVRK